MEIRVDPNADFCYTKQPLLKKTRIEKTNYIAFQVILSDCIL